MIVMSDSSIFDGISFDIYCGFYKNALKNECYLQSPQKGYVDFRIFFNYLHTFI